MASTELHLDAILQHRKEVADTETLANARLPPLPPTLEQFWIDIELPDGYRSHTLVTRPRPKDPLVDFLDSPRIVSLLKSPKRPLLVYFHPGGFHSGVPLSLTLPARLFAEELNITVLIPSYRFAPEHVWPRPFQDAMSIVQTVASNPTYHYGADLEQGYLIGGVGAGGSLAAVVAGLTTAEPENYPLYFPLTGVYISIAPLFVESIIPSGYKEIWQSREENRNMDETTRPTLDRSLDILQCSDYSSPWFSPLGNSAETRHKHPPVYLQTCRGDLMRDDIIIYEKILAEAEVKTRLHIFPEDRHDTLRTPNLLNPTKSTNPTVKEECLEGLRWLTGVVST